MLQKELKKEKEKSLTGLLLCPARALIRLALPEPAVAPAACENWTEKRERSKRETELREKREDSESSTCINFGWWGRQHRMHVLFVDRKEDNPRSTVELGFRNLTVMCCGLDKNRHLRDIRDRSNPHMWPLHR